MPRPATGKTFVARARIPLGSWTQFGNNVGDGNRSGWIKDFVDWLNINPTVWIDARRVAAKRGEVLGSVIAQALSRYVARHQHLLDSAEDE